ncbi:uncharacterized protein [Lolium perenne]|uniref:uncharacterized protein isoform X2 n=1 Tax=Lolium perenne TaxID=4522 RepID=UPI0021F63E7F|nr:uncharacterized protein LOC127305250 isoform X2 [Lolium perenne]
MAAGGERLQLQCGGRLRGERRARVSLAMSTASCSLSRSPASTTSVSVASAPPPPRPWEPLPNSTIELQGDGRHRRTSRLHFRPGLQTFRKTRAGTKLVAGFGDGYQRLAWVGGMTFPF